MDGVGKPFRCKNLWRVIPRQDFTGNPAGLGQNQPRSGSYSVLRERPGRKGALFRCPHVEHLPRSDAILFMSYRATLICASDCRFSAVPCQSIGQTHCHRQLPQVEPLECSGEWGCADVPGCWDTYLSTLGGGNGITAELQRLWGRPTSLLSTRRSTRMTITGWFRATTPPTPL